MRGPTRVIVGPEEEPPERASSLSPGPRPVLSHSGWEKFRIRSGEFFKGGRGGGSPRAPRLPPDFQRHRGPTIVRVDPRKRRLSGLPRPVPGPAAGSPYIRSGKSPRFLRAGFSKEGRGEGALGLPGSPLTSRAPRAGPRRRGDRPRSACPPISQLARPLGRFWSFLTGERGEGGESPGSQAPGVSVRTPWPPTAPLPRTQSPQYHTLGMAPVRSYRPRVFHRRGGGREP